MQLKQISVFLENKSGRLSRVTQILKEADIDILALCVADSNEYGILRNNASSILNLLCKNGKLVKINSRPVTFIDKEILNEMNKKYNVPIKNIYTFNELSEYILNTSINDPFEMLLGYNSSLLSQVRQAKAAIVWNIFTHLQAVKLVRQLSYYAWKTHPLRLTF